MAFLSYAHFDNEHDDNGVVSLFCNHLNYEVRLYTGNREFGIFSDRDIQWGENWQTRIENSLDAVTFLIPIITPSYFNSSVCKIELNRFIQREIQLQRNDLILPVYYVDCQPLNSVGPDADLLVKTIAAHQYVDWRELRFEDVKSQRVRRELANMARQIRDALKRTPPTPAPPGVIPTWPDSPSRSTSDDESIERVPPKGPSNSGTKKKPGRPEAFKRRQPSEPSPPQLPLQPEELKKTEVAEERQQSETRYPKSQTQSHLEEQSRSQSHHIELAGSIERKPRRAGALIKWTIGVVAVLTIGSVIWFALNPPAPKPVKPPPSTPIPPSMSFEFETLTFNSQGAEDSRRKLRAEYFTEDLDGVPLDVVKIPGGEFRMGSPDNEALRDSDEGPQHVVKVPDFFIGRFEITREQWRQVARMTKEEMALREDPSHFKDLGRQPVEQVSWKEADEFCKRLKKKTGRAYRLPTEAEWEYAARAGTTTSYAFGSTITTQIVNYNGNYPSGLPPEGIYRGKTVEVGSLGLANAFGLSDMHGNVWEWCKDEWRSTYEDAPRDSKADTTNGSQIKRVIRGGSWDSYRRNCRSALRFWYEEDKRSLNTGFRVVYAPRGQDKR